MRNLLALFGLLVIGFGGAGWYMGWYKLSVSRSTDGNLEIKTDVDTKKVGADSSEALKNIGTVIGNQAGKAVNDAKSAPDSAPGGTPGPVAPAQGSQFNPFGAPVPNAPTGAQGPVAPPAPQGGPVQLFPPK